jgi:predicted DNA-binding transcriptional regulator YafY
VQKKLRWGPERRLEFLEFLLFWEGGLNRADLVERFGVSVPQASNDISAYRELAPANIEYDASAKRYIATSEFQPRFLKPNPDRYLAQLKAISDGILDVLDTWIATVPPTGIVPIPGRKTDPEVLQAIAAAVRERQAIRIKYQSMSVEHPDPLWRWITPHAFAFDGLRWHVRAYCERTQVFLDFLIGRCLAASERKPAQIQATADELWESIFEVVLRPNPDLSENQQKIIARDYGMREGKVTVPVRYALLYYFNKRMRLDVGPHLDQPHERPIVVANPKEFAEALKRATAKPEPQPTSRV